MITNNLNVAALLCGKPDFEVTVAGGVVRSRDRGIVGEATVDLIRQFRVDFGVIGISGIDLDGTLLDFDYQEVRVAQAIIANSRQVYLAADHTKFGRNAHGAAGRGRGRRRAVHRHAALPPRSSSGSRQPRWRCSSPIPACGGLSRSIFRLRKESF